MSSLPLDSKGGNRASWTPAQDAFVVHFLAEQCSLGRFSNNGFKKEILRKAAEELNKKFNILMKMCGIVIFKAHPKAKAYRRTSFPLYDNLSIIYEGCMAEGKRQKSSRIPITQPCVEEKIPVQNCASPTISQPPSNERVEESGLSSENVVVMTQKDNRSKRCSAVPISLNRQKRDRTSVGERIANEISRMVTSSDRLCAVTPPTSTKDSYEICLEELQKIEELDEDTVIEAVKFIRDRQNAIAFMTLKGPL
ncbi:hypothetical protein CKAN_01749900 [Cinnamomum micranthum f. kanehirae]|uniref:Myb/SANT-like domain-containing protein n=1 Tax=Cinnamomum micranthum f. kanehirae TaxID=337451 RepID=A0A443PCI6_9MAGN|nr:hypothetical protein CKAN_01749900 [Cinnamomum micranthum f. kanehirae]